MKWLAIHWSDFLMIAWAASVITLIVHSVR